MPTRRTYTLLFLASLLYFLANQTQVGWLYIISNSLLALLFVTFLYSWRLLRPLEGKRRLLPPDRLDEEEEIEQLPTFHEEDPIVVQLEVRNLGRRALFGVRGEESCSFAPPDEQAQRLFIPSLFQKQSAILRYQTRCDRRGVYHFKPVSLTSGGPFGLFRTTHQLDLPHELLIYPFYHPLKRFQALESYKLPQRPVTRRGTSGEVIGVRDYRTGDAMRTIHWRSSARMERLIVKEFADEEEATLTVALDLFERGNLGEGKYSTFETAIRIATSLGYYATQKKIPFQLIGESPNWRAPRTTLSWWALRTYLAKVQNDGEQPFERVLQQAKQVPLLVPLISAPTPAIFKTLQALQRRGTRIFAIGITPDGQAGEKTMGGVEVVWVSPHNWVEILTTNLSAGLKPTAVRSLLLRETSQALRAKRKI